MSEIPQIRPIRREMPAEVVNRHDEITKMTNESTDFWIEEDPDNLQYALLEIRELLDKHKLPREILPHVFHYAFEKLQQPMSLEAAKGSAMQLIDLAYNQKDQAMNLRLSALLAHEVYDDNQSDIVDKYMDSEQPADADSRKIVEKMKSSFFKTYAFEQAAADPNQPEEYREFAKQLLKPEPDFKAFLKKHSVADLLKPARFLSEEEVLAAGAAVRGLSEGPLQFSGNRIRLPVGHMPSPEKVKEYHDRTGRLPAVSLAYQEGDKRFYIDMTEALTRRALKAGYRRKMKTATAEVAAAELEVILIEFLQSMPPEQQNEMADRIGVSLEMRFTTERNKRKSEATITLIREVMDEVNAELAHLDQIKKVLEERLAGKKKKAA